MAAKETYQGSLTQGTISPRDSRADMVIHVTGLDGTRTSLDTAITSAKTGRLVHPDDTSLPLRYATARWLRGADNGSNAEALVFLTYDKRGSGTAGDAAQFSQIANVVVRGEKIPWWGETLDDPAAEFGKGPINTTSDPRAGNANIEIPQQQHISVSIWDITVPVVLTSSPISNVDGLVDRVNSGAYTLGGKSFPPNTLLFRGLSQSVVKVDTGASVTYEYHVNYLFSRRKDGWYSSYLTTSDADPNQYAASKRLMYPSASFTTPPTS